MPISKTNTTQSHTTSQKLVAAVAELTTGKRHVESLAVDLHTAHETAASHSAEILRLHSTHVLHDVTQTDLVRREAEEASWSVLRVELTRQAEYTRTRDLEAACARTTAELSAMCERHTAIIEVLRE